MRKIKSIILDAGGAGTVAEESKKTTKSVGADGVRKWYRTGIPEVHWPMVMRLAEVTADDLVQANEHARTSATANKESAHE